MIIYKKYSHWFLKDFGQIFKKTPYDIKKKKKRLEIMKRNKLIGLFAA